MSSRHHRAPGRRSENRDHYPLRWIFIELGRPGVGCRDIRILQVSTPEFGNLSYVTKIRNHNVIFFMFYTRVFIFREK